MRAEIKFLHSTEILEGLETYSPSDEDVFCIPITIGIGSKEREGADNFDLLVCSPGWLAQDIKEGDVRLLRHILLVKTFDWRRIRAFIDRYVSGIEAETWEEIANKLARLGHWEFEDYRP